ncbi:ATP-binding cassette, subfamily A (ABC1), member 1, partial [Mytilus galloprovincialis]
MGVIRQIRQLLWKNFVQRIREPHILLLEIVWPIFIFVIVALIRTAIPPEDKPTCSYAPHAMPSAGLVPFLQSSICNIDNKCEDRQKIEDRLAQASKLSALVSDVEPYIVKESTLDALDSIETAVELADVLVNPSTNGSLTSFIGNETLMVKSFFKDPGKIKTILVDEMKVMSPVVADAFLNSTVNVIELFNAMTTGYIDFKGIVCDQTKLASYMFFQKNVNMTMVSRELCEIPDDAISGITDMILQQLDVAAIFRVAKSFTALSMDYELADAIDDIATMIDLLSGTSSLSSFFGSMSDIQNMKDMLKNIPMYLDTLTKMGKLDTRSFDDLLSWVEPLVKRYSSDLTGWNQTVAMFQQFKQITDSVGSGTDANWTALFSNGMGLLDSFNSNDTDTTLLTQLMSIQSIPDLTNLTMALITGDMTALSQLTTTSSLTSLQQMVTSMIGESTMQSMLGIADTLVDMAMLTMEYLKGNNPLGSNRFITDMMKEDSAVINAMEKLTSYGPNVTMEVMYRMLQIDNVMTLYNSTNSYVTVCHDVMKNVKDINETTRSMLDSVLCIDDISTAIIQMVAAFNTQTFQKQMETHLMKMDNLLRMTTVPSELKLDDVYKKVENLTAEIGMFMNMSLWFGDITSATGIDTNTEEWKKVSDKVSGLMSQTSWPVVIVTVGPLIEETEVWKSMEPTIRTINTFMESSVKQMEQLNDASSSMSKVNEMLKYAMQYSPELVQGVFDMMKNPDMMNAAFSSKDMADFCQKQILLSMPMPSYVPVSEINDMMCTTNWTEVIIEMTAMYDMTGAIEKMMSAMMDNSTESSPFDWTGMVKNVDKMVTIYSSPTPLMEGNPIVTIMSMNMSILQETMNVVMNNLQEMNVQNITALTSLSLSMMEQLDTTMSSNNMWRTMKVYLDFWNSYVLLVNKQLENPQLIVDINFLANMSSTFAEFIQTSSAAIPGLLEALKNTTVDVTQFFKVLMAGDWTKICQGTKITDLLTSSPNTDLAKFEDVLCKMNWTKILIELGENQDVDVQLFTQKIINLFLIDRNNVPNIDLDWNAIEKNTGRMFELLMTVNVDSLVSWDKLFTQLNLQKSNTTWNDFISVFTMTKDLDVKKQYFNSEEVNKLLDTIAFSPEVSTVALLTLVDTLQDPNKVNKLLNSWEEMCSDLSVFKSVISIPANTTVDPADLQTKICGVYINYTKLYEELLTGVDGLPELFEALTKMNGSAVPTEFWKIYETYNELLMDMINNPPNITISDSNAWLMESQYTKAWENFVSRVADGFKPENYITTLTSFSQKSQEAALSSLASVPEFNAILNYVSVYMKVILNRFNQSTSVNDFAFLFDGYPEMEKVTALMDDLPQLYQVWVFNSIYHSDKISSLLVNLQSWDQFCDMTDPLFDVPGSNFSISGFQSALCNLNLTRLMLEATEYNAVPEIEQLFSNTSGSPHIVNTTELVAQFNQFSNFLMGYIEKTTSTDLGNYTLPKFLNMQYWIDASEMLNSVISDPARLMQLSTSLPKVFQSTSNATDLQGLIQTMVDSDPVFKQSIQTYKAFYVIFQHFISRIENKTVITMEDLFGNATEIIKLWELFIRPGVLETVLNSVNTPQMTSLFTNDNITTVMMSLCYTGNFSHYFIVPSYISLDIEQLKTDFCALDLMKVSSEIMHEIDSVDSAINEAFSNTTEIGWDIISKFLGIDQTLTNQMTALIGHPPMLELPTTWMNESYWMNLLAQYTQSRQDQQDIAAELLTFMNSLQPMLNEEPFLSMGHIMDTYLQLLLDNLQAVNSTTLTLDNMFRSIPALSDIYTTLKINDSVLNELFMSPMKNPKEFLKLMSLSDPYKYFCEDEKHWHIIFVVNADTPSKICSGNSSEILEELMNKLKISDYMSAVQNSSVLPDWANIIRNSMKLSDVIMQMISSDNIKFDLSKTLTTLSSYNNTDFLWNYLSLFSQLGTQVNNTSSETWGELDSIFKNMQLATQLTNVIMDKILTPGNKIDFGAIVRNTSVVTALLNSIDLSSDSVNGLFNGYLRAEKISQFLSILGDGTALESFLCDQQQWHDIFDFPPSLNLSEIITPLCQNNNTDVLVMLSEQLELQSILPLIANQSAPFNIQTFSADIEKLTANLMKLFDVTAVDFSGVDLDKTFDVNMTALMTAIQTESEKLQGPYPDMYTKLVENVLRSLINISDPSGRLPVYVLAAANVWISIFNRQLADFTYKPMNVSTLLYGSNVGKAVDMLLHDPSWIDELFDAQIDTQKMAEFLMNSSASICTQEFWEGVVTSGNMTAVKKVWETVCDLNESTIVQEAMSGFVNSHLFQQQLAALTEEMNKGILNISTLYPNLVELSSIINNMIHQTPDVSSVFNVTSFSSLFERLGMMLQKELGQKLTDWTSMFLPLLSAADETLVKATQTFNVILKEINSRLMHMQGTVSLSALLKNSTELVDIFQSIFNIANNGTQAVESNNIDVSKLSEVISTSTLFTELCKNKTLADYITPDGVVSPIAADLGKVMCIYPEAFLQVLMDQSQSQQLQKQIEDIWNSNSSSMIDWMNVQQNINNFTVLLTALIEKPPNVDNSLTTMLDVSLLMKSLEGIFQSPQTIFALTGSLSSLLNIPVDTSIYPYYLTWQEVYTQMNAIIGSLKNSPSDSNGAIQNLWNAMLSLDSHLSVIQKNASYDDLVAQLGKDPELQSKICDQEQIQSSAGSDSTEKVYNALCGQDPKDWNKRLVDTGFPEYYGYFLLTNMMQKSYSNTSMSELLNTFITQIQSLTTSLSKMGESDLTKLENILLGDLTNLTISQQFYQSFNWLNLIDNTTEGWLLGMLNFVTEINVYVERQFSMLKGMGAEVPLTLLLPNNTAVAQLLEATFGKQTAATLLTSYMAPEKFLEIAFSNSWEEYVCKDVATFTDTFRIDADSGINITLLQRDLCEDLSKQDSTIKSILQRLDMSDVFNAFNDWMMAIQQKIEEFVTTVTKISNVTLTEDGMDAWLTPIWTALSTLSMPQDSIGETCNAVISYIENSAMYLDDIRPVLVGVYQSMNSQLSQMKLQTAIEEMICGEPVNSTVFLQRFISSNITTFLTQILNPAMDVTGKFQCSEMVDLVNQLAGQMNESIYSMMTGNHMEKCGDNFYQSLMMFVQDSSSSFQLIQEIMKMLSDPSLQGLMGNQDLLGIAQFFLNAYSQQQGVSLKFINILTSPGDFSAILQQTMSLAPEMINTLMQSTLNTNATSLSNVSSSELMKILCNSTALDQYLTVPSFSNITTSDLTKALCNNATGVIATVARGLLDVNLLNVLNTANATDLTWWTVTLGHLGDVIGQLNSLSSLPSLDFTKMDFNNLQADLLIYMQKFLFDNGPEAIARSLNVLIEDFSRLDPTVLTDPIVKDIQAVTLGLTSLKVIRNFIPPNVLIRDVVKDREQFKNYMTQNLNLSSDVADAILSSTIKYASLLGYNEKDILGMLCNATRLETVVSLPTSSNVTSAHLVESLCSLSEEKAINLTMSLLMELDIGEMVETYVSSGIDSLLQSLNKSQDEIKDAVNKLSSAQDDFQLAADSFKTSTERLNLNIFLEPEYLTGSQGQQTLGDILCGYETSRIESSAAGEDLSGASSQLSGVTKMVERQQSELSEMPETCKNIYDLIKGMDNGPVLWEYLKPLLWGKILYTPDTPEGRLIAEKVYNSSFKGLADVQRIAKSWAMGTENLVNMLKDKDMQSKLQSMLGNTVIDNVMLTLFGVSGKDFLDGFYSINSVNTSQLDAMSSVATLVHKYMSCIVTDRFEGTSTEQQLEIRAAELNIKKQFLAGLVFDNLGNGGGRKKRATTTSLPKHVSYKIRMDIDNVMYTRNIKEQYWHPKPEDDFFTELRYLRGFLQIQDILDRSIISLQTGAEVDSPIYMQQFPATCYRKDTYLFTLSTFLLPVLMTVAWLVSVAIATRNLVNDRERGQEEILKIMGMSSVLNWWVWFFYFCFSSIMLCYMVSALFTRTTLALLTVVIVYFLSYLPYIVLTSLDYDMLFWQKTLACLSSTTAFGFGAHHLSRYETLMEGIQWSNIDKSPILGDETSFSWCCYMMLIDGCIYLVIGWYIRNVKPGKYGVPRPWYFPISPYYWGFSSSSTSSASKYKKEIDGLNEPMDKNRVAGISLKNLTKKFGKTTAVNNISAEIYEHQVTVLLGHNGAAKTTTMNMITGMLQPSSGSVKIYGKSPTKAKNIGLCPQHSALFDFMTVQEHMEFYGSVKSNWPKDQLKENIYQLLKEVGLLHVHNTKSSQLSGGMQKRLSVAIAFVGGSEVVVLDEPSSGVDPSARRAMWNLILKRKTNCTVLLSTHFLDEADMIGDRIAIMHNGQMMCTGSSHFLKANLGSGYHLKIAKGDRCDQMSVMGLITSLLPRADIIEDIGAEMTVSLSATVDSLQKCLHELDVKGEELGIASYGLYDTTLEEVFLKVCHVSDKGVQLTEDVMHSLRKQTNLDMLKTSEESEPITDYESGEVKESTYADPRKRIGICSQSFQQIGALLLKRFHHYKRDWRMLFGLVILPLIFITAGLAFFKIKPELSSPQLILTPALYGPNAYVFHQDNVQSVMTMKMRYQLTAPPGPGTTCMAGMNLGEPYRCENADTSFHTPTSASTGTPECHCAESKYTCNDAAKYQSVPWMKMNTTDKLQDLNGHDIQDYLLMTRSEFREKRYGGWSFDADGTKFRSTVWFNNKGHHALPSFTNGLSNVMLRAMVPSGEAEQYGITAYTHPLMLTDGQLSEDTLLQKAADYGISVIFLVAFTFIPAGLMVYVVNEYTNKEKQLQFLSGVGPFMYWTTSFLWDMCIYSIMMALTVALMAAFQDDAYWHRDNLAAVVTLIILFGWATIPQMYMSIKIFKDATTSYMVMFCSNIFIGIVSMAVIFILQFFSQIESVENAYQVMRHALKIFPPFNLVSGFVELIYNQMMSDILGRFGDDPYVWPFDFDVIGWQLVALAIEGLIFFIITLLVEIRISHTRRTKRHEEELEYLDAAVSNERTRVNSGYAKDDILVINNLTKEYTRGRREFNAVDHICVGVPRGECFGLLGENGAGKTTSFRMLTGDLLPTEGEATIKGHRISRADASIGQEVGYCPQEDALDGCLTGREMLHCYARLRGLPADSRKYVVNDVIKKFGLKEADKSIHHYSGGMKRKLSVAIAMLGEPPVVLLDEPTTGMDPNTRRHVWNILLAAVKNQQSVVLSSHSMEECDALCTRLAIMVNGEFKCLGSPQQLKNLYGDGYIVTVYMSGLSTNKVRVRDFFLSTFHGCRTREDHHGVLQIEIPKGKSFVSDIFVHLEQIKHQYNIMHYSVSQTTLDNVFLNFVRDQNDGVVPEIYESSSEGSTSGDTWTEGSSEAFANPHYAYNNEGFTTEKDSLP